MDKKIFTTNEIMILLERLEGKFDILLENQVGTNDKVARLQERVDAIFEMVVQNTEDIAMMKLELREINRKLTHKVDREELVLLEKRVDQIEKILKSRKI